MAYGENMKRLNPCADTEILGLLRQYCPDLCTLLDAGCGRGDRLAAVHTVQPETLLCGIDRDVENAARAKEACPTAEILTGDAAALPYGDGTFDAALCECTLSLTDAPAACLEELHRVLRPGGVLLLGDLCAPGNRTPLALEGPGLRRLFFRDRLTAETAAAGFRLREYQDRSGELLALAGQMIFDGSFCTCVGQAGLAAMKKYKAGYGLWVLERMA